jgi:CRISPR-associated protein Cas1
MRKKIKNLHTLPRIRNSWSYLYVEHCLVEKRSEAVCLIDKAGRVPLPVSCVTLLMLGPGCSISHHAMVALAEAGCLVAWVGEEGVRSYAFGMGKSRTSRHLQHQAAMVSDEEKRLAVVRRLYEMRFDSELSPDLTLQQIRGKEGARVRDAYAEIAQLTGVPWTGREYDRGNFRNATPINRALSVANACLYGVCHAAIVAAGYSPGLGFIHTGKMLSFVYDVADLYKTDFTLPAAFLAVSEPGTLEKTLEARVRHACRNAFRATNILARIVPDIQYALGEKSVERVTRYDDPDDPPGELWDPRGNVQGGVAFDEENS